MKTIWIILKALTDGLLTDATEVARKLSLQGSPGGTRTRQEVYLRSLKRLLLWTALFPIPILLLGIFLQSNWLIALVGLFWCLCTFALILVAAPLGILLGALLGKTDGSGERYVKLAIGVFLTELIFTLFVAIIPVRNNLRALPLVIICSVILALFATTKAAKTGFTKNTIAKLVGIILVILTISFFFPNTFNSLKHVREKADTSIASALNNEEKPEYKIPPPPEYWYVSWKKLPGERGFSDERERSFPVKELRTGETIFILVKTPSLRLEYSGSKNSNGLYSGIYKDSNGHQGTFEDFGFTAPGYADGWEIDAGGNKARLILVRK